MPGAPPSLSEVFRDRYPSSPAPRVWRAPGRVNLIGEHTDYNLGFVLPIALDLECRTAAAAGSDGVLRVWGDNVGQARAWPVETIGQAQPAGDWSDYVMGVARELVRAGYAVPATNLAIHSTVPVGAGLSSSAALEASVALALLDGRPIERVELARLCRRAENDFVGMPCGIMDQFVSVFGQANAAIRIDCRTLEHEAVPLPAGVAIVAVNTMVKHELGQSAYRQRVAECAEAARTLGVGSLREAASRDVEAAADRLAPHVLRRARHITGENERVGAFVEASRRSDLEEMGRLFVASHRSLQHDYEVSCEELDFLVDAALAIAGVYGARMTGGGFGGCTVNLVRPEAAAAFEQALAAAYERRFGMAPQFYACRPAQGAGRAS